MGVMNLAEIMDKAIDILKKHIKQIILFSLVYGLISCVLVFAVILIGVIFSFPFIKFTSGYLAPGILIFFIIALILTVTYSYSVGLIRITSQDFFNERISFEDGIKISFKSLPRVFGIAVITVIGFLPIAGIFFAIVYFGYGGFKNDFFIQRHGVVFAIITAIIALAAYVSYFAYNTILSFSIYGVAIEKKGAFASIKRSYQLVKSNFWRIFGSLLAFSFTVYALRSTIESFFFLVINLIYLLLKFINVETNYLIFINMLTTMIRGPLSFFSLVVITPIGTIMISLLYFNQRFKKEGYDLLLRLKEIEKKERIKVSETFKYDNSNPTGV